VLRTLALSNRAHTISSLPSAYSIEYSIAVNREVFDTPQMTHIAIESRPKSEIGKKSPYPAVDIVIIVIHRELLTL